MTNVATALRSEIVRLSRKSARQYVAPVQKLAAAHRRQIAALRRQVAALEKALKAIRNASHSAPVELPDPDSVRFVPKGLVSLRKRLGLSAGDLGKLLGASGQSVYNWEARKTVPRKAQVAAIAALRGIGKRESRARLAAMMPNRTKS